MYAEKRVTRKKSTNIYFSSKDGSLNLYKGDCRHVLARMPEESVDLIFADVAWLEENRDRIEAIFITHAHEDHVGALGAVRQATRAPVGLHPADAEAFEINPTLELIPVSWSLRPLLDAAAHWLRRGMPIAELKIVEIRREQVVVEVEEFGLTEQKIMQLQTRRLGGQP